MKFDSPFSSTIFGDLMPGAFFFHPLSGDHSPAFKVKRADGEMAAIDLNLEQDDQSRMPTLVDPDHFQGVNVIAVESALIRPTPGISHIKNGSGAFTTISRGALVLSPAGKLLRVKGPNMATLEFNVETGMQANGQDSTRCIWSYAWQILVVDNQKETILFDRQP